MVIMNCALIIVVTILGCYFLTVYGEAPKARYLTYGVCLTILVLYPLFTMLILYVLGIIVGIILVIWLIALIIAAMFKAILSVFN